MGTKNRFYADIMAINQEVTGSCNLIVVRFPDKSSVRFVVDCGLFQERKYNELNETLEFDPQNIDFCIVTHNHVDHTGRLPLMVKNGYCNEIYATESTCKLLPLGLYDSFKVLMDVYKKKHMKCLYSEADVSRTLSLLTPCKYNETFMVGDNIKVTFFMNGHLVGAAVVLVQISYPGYEDINLMFTGDYNNKNVFFNVDPIPDWATVLPLTLIQESTYGNMLTLEIQKTFKQNIKECLSNNGSVLALVFSIGRTQEILYELKKMQDNGELDSQIPIYLDGSLAVKYTGLYLSGKLNIKNDLKYFLPKNLEFVDLKSRERVLDDESKKIILTTSGMGSYGPAQTYIPIYLSRKNALIQFTGFTAEGTMGHRLKNAIEGEKVACGGMSAFKHAQVEYTNEFSGHAKADEMIEFLKQFKNLKLVLVNHGETNSKELFAQTIENEINPKKVEILGREQFFRVNPYGLVKTLSTKFK